MTERPILFSAPMVLALLAGTKTQTRRIVKDPASPARGKRWSDCLCREIDTADQPCVRCSAIAGRNPYGKPGDQLWVKESIRRVGPAVGPEEYCASEFIADGAFTLADAWPWKNKALPSIHMPRGLARLELEVTGVRVEQLQAISEKDAIAEGVERHTSLELFGWFNNYKRSDWACPSAIESYSTLWESINGAGSWSTNPWVWVITFKRIEATCG